MHIHFPNLNGLIPYLNGDLIYLVEDVDAGDVDSIAFHHINQFFGGTV